MFTDCPENGCGDLITLFSQDFKGITPEAFIGDLIKKKGGKPSECKIQKDETSTYSTSRYSVRTKDEVIVSKEEIYTAVKDSSDQKFKSRKEYEEYCFKNKDNPTCAYDERYAQIKKEQNLCSKYVGGNVFKGDSAYFLFRMDGEQISSLKEMANALFINIQAGNGAAPDIDLVQLVR